MSADPVMPNTWSPSSYQLAILRGLQRKPNVFAGLLLGEVVPENVRGARQNRLARNRAAARRARKARRINRHH